MLVAGVDDAGRGAILGPLVIAGVLFHEEDLPKLVEMGVKDSKLLSPRRREQLAAEVKRLSVRLHVVKLTPAEIDRVVETGRKLHRLNWLEAKAMAEVIEALKPDVAYVDASDTVAERFGSQILERLSFRVRVVSEHKADRKYPVVSAASIIAKVERDKAILQIREKYGDVGCGYATDPRTIKFLEEYLRKHGSHPDFVRKSWKPAKRLKTESRFKQKTLS